jgi:hypothetical protein
MTLVHNNENRDAPVNAQPAVMRIRVGELVQEVSEGVRPAYGSGDRIEGVAIQRETGDAIAQEDDEPQGSFVYRPSDNDRALHAGKQNGVRFRVLTPPSSVKAPDITHGDIVGVADAGSDHYGRIVQEGYTADPDGDGTSTTFSRANGNLLAVGVARESQAESDELVRIERRLDI